MTRSEELRKNILLSFQKVNAEVTGKAFDTVVESVTELGYTSKEVAEEIQQMDATHKGFLKLVYPLDAQGWGIPNISNVSTWLSGSGEKYLNSLVSQKKTSAISFFDKYVYPIVSHLISAGIGALITYLLTR